MRDRGEIEALVRGLCAARVAGDMDALRRGYANHATFRIAGSPAWGALTALVTGQANIMARFESMIAKFAVSDFEILNLFVAGNKVRRPLARHHAPGGHQRGVHHRNCSVPRSRERPSGFFGRVPRYRRWP